MMLLNLMGQGIHESTAGMVSLLHDVGGLCRQYVNHLRLELCRSFSAYICGARAVKIQGWAQLEFQTEHYPWPPQVASLCFLAVWGPGIAGFLILAQVPVNKINVPS